MVTVPSFCMYGYGA